MKKIPRILAAGAASFLYASTAFAAPRTMTIESRVETVRPMQGVEKTATYRVMGPDSVEYILEAPPAEVQRLTRIIENNPETTVRFEGEVVEGPNRRFKVERWEESTRTIESASGDSATVRSTTTTREGPYGSKTETRETTEVTDVE